MIYPIHSPVLSASLLLLRLALVYRGRRSCTFGDVVLFFECLLARVKFLLWQEEVDVEAIRKVFPYGQLLPVEFQSGGMRASSGIALPEMGGVAYARRHS